MCEICYVILYLQIQLPQGIVILFVGGWTIILSEEPLIRSYLLR